VTTGAQRSIERQKRNVEFLARLYGNLPWGGPESRQVRRQRERALAKAIIPKRRRP
jgi:hypothetical protein